MAPTLTSSDRSDYLKWMFFASATLDTVQTRIMVIEDIPEGNVQKEKLAALQSDTRDSMEALDKVFEKNQYLVANSFSTADISVSYHLYWLKLWPELYSVMKEFPSVISYLDRMEAHPSAVKAKVFSYEG